MFRNIPNIQILSPSLAWIDFLRFLRLRKEGPGLHPRHTALVRTDSGQGEHWIRTQAAVPMDHRSSQATSYHSDVAKKPDGIPWHLGEEQRGGLPFFQGGAVQKLPI